MALSIAWPTPAISVAGRSYFRRIRDREQGLVFGEPALARLTGIVSFVVARRRTGSSMVRW